MMIKYAKATMMHRVWHKSSSSSMQGGLEKKGASNRYIIMCVKYWGSQGAAALLLLP